MPGGLSSALTTPTLVLDMGEVRAAYGRLKAARPDIKVHYAVKCNPHPEVLRTIRDAGGSFEVASLGELEMLCRLGATPRDVLFSAPIKPAADVAAAHLLGLDRFAVDSPSELHKIACHAPGSRVYVRLAVRSDGSCWRPSTVFGATDETAVALLIESRRLGLVPYGLSFHVGSQVTEPACWTDALLQCAGIMATLDSEGVRLQAVDIGGGFPVVYDEAGGGCTWTWGSTAGSGKRPEDRANSATPWSRCDPPLGPWLPMSSSAGPATSQT